MARGIARKTRLRSAARAHRSGLTRRRFLDRAVALGAAAAVSASGAWAVGSDAAKCDAWVAGSDAPEKVELHIGFMALTDCAPIAVAVAEGFDRKHGIRIVPRRVSSWAAMRDRLMHAEIDAAHMLYSSVYATELGIGGVQREMAVLMGLSQNGQAITFSHVLAATGIVDGDSLRRALASGARRTFAQTFPTGTHALWLNYWLAAHGIDPLREVDTITVAPVQMVQSMRAGRMDGCCVGEPWNAQAVRADVGFTVATSQQIWADHPEKALASTRRFVACHPNSARALVAALLEAARFADVRRNRPAVARLISSAAYVDTDVAAIEARLLGRYDDGRGRVWDDTHAVRFHADGAVNYPYVSDATWFMTQQRRWRLLDRDPDYDAVAQRVQQSALYRDAAAAANVGVPASPLRSARLIDGSVWTGEAPARYAASFDIGAPRT